MLRIGLGIDVHRFCSGNMLMLGGVAVPAEVGVKAHSDGDVILHALCDALLGAAALGDIGTHFPDSDPRWKNAPSSWFVEHTVSLLREHSLRVVNIDITVLLEAPKIAPYRDKMRYTIAQLCSVTPNCVSVKATTSEGIGFIGRREGIAAYCVCLLEAAQ